MCFQLPFRLASELSLFSIWFQFISFYILGVGFFLFSPVLNNNCLNRFFFLQLYPQLRGSEEPKSALPHLGLTELLGHDSVCVILHFYKTLTLYIIFKIPQERF